MSGSKSRKSSSKSESSSKADAKAFHFDEGGFSSGFLMFSYNKKKIISVTIVYLYYITNRNFSRDDMRNFYGRQYYDVVSNQRHVILEKIIVSEHQKYHATENNHNIFFSTTLFEVAI